MAGPSSILRLSSMISLTLSLLLLSFTFKTNAWRLEFWAGQADCNYEIDEYGRKIAADTWRAGDDNVSNNCMEMSYNPMSEGLMAMRVMGWTADCAIALWSDNGSLPCIGDLPYNPGCQKPDYVFTMKSPEAALAIDEDGTKFACITPLNSYVQSFSGFLGYVAYSCGGNGTLLVDEFENDYSDDQIESLIKSFSTSTAAAEIKATDFTAIPTGFRTVTTAGNITTKSNDTIWNFWPTAYDSHEPIGTQMATETAAPDALPRLRVGIPVPLEASDVANSP